MLYVRVSPARLTPLGWTLMATLVSLLLGALVAAPGTLAAVLIFLFLLLALVISIVDEMTYSIHKPESRRDQDSGA